MQVLFHLINRFTQFCIKAVGKTSILQKFTANEFSEEYQVTVGVEFGSKTIEIDDSTKVKLQIWDTAGQERFRTITGAYYKGAHAILIVYDITRKESFDDIDTFWIG